MATPSFNKTDISNFHPLAPRINTRQDLLSSTARTADVNTSDIVNPNMRGGHITIDVTVDPASASVVFTVQGKDELSGKYYPILVSAAIAAVGTTILRIYPGCIAVNNLVANDVLPRIFRVNCNHADGDSITYSLGFAGIV